MTKHPEDIVKELLNKAGEAASPEAAVKYSQAACNAANAHRVLIDAKNATR